MPNQISRTGRILLLTVQPGSGDTLATLFERHGHEAAVATSLDEAFDLVEEHLPDLILLDLAASGFVHLDMLAALHQQPRLQQIPVIMLAPVRDRAQVMRAFEAGAVDCIDSGCAEDEIMARVQTHLRLKLTRDRLEQVARERQALVTLVAHDLKNPLTSVLFACEMLALPDCKPDRAPRYLRIIDESTREALSYIRNYLQRQARAASAGSSDDIPCASLGDTLRWLADRYELQLEASGLRLSLTVPDADACVAVDALVLRQLGENLISNALKYAAGGGELELAARPGAPGFWQLLVQDRGPGIPACFQPQLFMPFTRAHQDDAAATHSSGLGLALAREIVNDAGGRLWYEDREGGGARFLLELPETPCTPRCE